MTDDLFDPQRLRGRWSRAAQVVQPQAEHPKLAAAARAVDLVTTLVPVFEALRARVHAELPEHRAVLSVFLEQAELELHALVEGASAPQLAERAAAVLVTLDRLESLLEVYYFQLPRSARS